MTNNKNDAACALKTKANCFQVSLNRELFTAKIVNTREKQKDVSRHMFIYV